MSGSYKTKPSDWLRIVLEIEGKIKPKRKPRPLQPRPRMRIDQMADYAQETERLLKLRGEQEKEESRG